MAPGIFLKEFLGETHAFNVLSELLLLLRCLPEIVAEFFRLCLGVSNTVYPGFSPKISEISSVVPPIVFFLENI